MISFAPNILYVIQKFDWKPFLAGEIVSVSVAALADVPRLQGERRLVVGRGALLGRAQVELGLKLNSIEFLLST